MKCSFEGKVALVTGANRGIGSVIATKLAEYGADIVIFDIDIDETNEVYSDIRALGRKVKGVKLDITNVDAVYAAVKETVAEMGKIDILVNNAGAFPPSPMMDADEKYFDFTVSVNLKGMFFVTQAVVKESMIPNNYGRIVSISSCDGKTPSAGVAVYGAAKAGVIAISNSYALELADYDINSNVVAPGWVESKQVLAGDRWKDAIKLIPARRLGHLSEIANAVCFLCDDEVSYINGETLDVNGGIIMD